MMTVNGYADVNDDPDNLTTFFIPLINRIPIYPIFLSIYWVRVVRVVRNAHGIDVCWLTTMTTMTTKNRNLPNCG